MLKRFMCIIALLGITGCATVFTGTSSTIQMRVVDAANDTLLTNVRCSVTDNDGIVYTLDGNPGSFIVPKGKGTLRVSCVKPGYTQMNMGVAQSFNGVSLVNLLVWPGFIVDAVTGSMHKYPATATIQMKKI